MRRCRSGPPTRPPPSPPPDWPLDLSAQAEVITRRDAAKLLYAVSQLLEGETLETFLLGPVATTGVLHDAARPLRSRRCGPGGHTGRPYNGKRQRVHP